MTLFRISSAFTLTLASFCTSACDEGPIYGIAFDEPTESRAATFTGTLLGADRWTEGYDLVLAAFSADGEYALVQKPAKPAADGSVSLALSGIPAEAATVELCVTDRLRRRIVSFESLELSSSAADTLRLTLREPLDVGMFASIQRYVFDGPAYNCSLCHSAEGARAGLDLSAGHSYAGLVGVASSRVEGAQRVVPGSSSASVLHSALAEGNPAGLRYDHSPLLPAPLRRLIDDWIDGGAKE